VFQNETYYPILGNKLRNFLIKARFSLNISNE
jgi:hypothetical protein